MVKTSDIVSGRSNSKLYFHLTSGLVPSSFPTKTLYAFPYLNVPNAFSLSSSFI
jgi:hypothetical protein